MTLLIQHSNSSNSLIFINKIIFKHQLSANFMWSLKFKVVNKDSIYTLLTAKYKVADFFYPLDVYRKGNRFHILGIHLLEGEEAEKKGFAKDLKNHRKTIEFEQEENTILTLMKEE